MSPLEHGQLPKEWSFALLDQTDVLGVALDRDGRIIDWNASCERTTGFSFDEVRGRCIWEFLLAQEEREEGKRLFAELVDGRCPLRHESVWLTKSGNRRWILWSNTSVAGVEGRVEYVIETGVDITERKHAEEERLRLLDEAREGQKQAEKAQEEARRSALLVAAIVENIPDMIFVKEAKTLEFVLLNRGAEELLGWSRNELMGKTGRGYFPDDEMRFFEEKDRAVLSSGTWLDIPEEPIQTLLKGERILHTKKIPIVGDDGTPLFLLGISEDITERKKADRERSLLLERLATAVRTREDLLAVVAHDLRSPLSTIAMSAGLLSRLAPSDEAGVRVRDTTRRIQRSAEHMGHLIGNLLDAAAIEAGQFPVSRSLHDATALVDEALEMMLPLARDRAVRLERRYAAALPILDCDRERLLQVFSNLVGNAVKFTPAGGSITVSAEHQGGVVHFAVADSGEGIPEEALPHIFDRYWQASRAQRAGAGLGLYIVKGIVEAQGGKVWVESRLGAGSTFHFTVPVAMG